MWFKMSTDFFSQPVVVELSVPRYRSDNTQARVMIFIRALCATANGATFADIASFKRCVGGGAESSAIVWDAMIKHGVLVNTDVGYSALNWLKTNNLCGESKRMYRRVSKPTTASFMEDSNDTRGG
jgi:hypothetical protein